MTGSDEIGRIIYQKKSSLDGMRDRDDGVRCVLYVSDACRANGPAVFCRGGDLPMCGCICEWLFTLRTKGTTVGGMR